MRERGARCFPGARATEGTPLSADLWGRRSAPPPGIRGVGHLVNGMFNSPGQRALEGRLAELIAGRSVLAQQVANIDTPGYSGQNLSSFASTMAQAVSAQLGGTLPGTGAAAPVVPLVPAAGGQGASPGQTVALASGGGSGAITPDGNGMDFDALMANLAKTDLDYQAVSRQLQLTYTRLGDAIDFGR